jgi:hypothetical protein
MWRVGFRTRGVVLGGTACLVGLAAGALALGLPGSAGSGVRSAPALVLSVNGSVDGFALDGNHFVYAGGHASDLEGCATVELGSFGSNAHTRLGAEVLGAPGADACDFLPLVIALGGTRAVWAGFEDCCIGGYGSVTTGAPGTKAADLDGLGQTFHDIDGDFLTGVAGDRQTLVYAIVTVELVRNFDGCLPAMEPPPGLQTCDFKVTKWKVKRVVGRRAVAVPNVPAAALIAVSRGRLALVPADQSKATCNAVDLNSFGGCPRSESTALPRFEIRAVSNGSIVAGHDLTGTPTAIGLSDRLVAVLVRHGATAQLERYDAHTGALNGRTLVPAATADQIDISGSVIVYHVKKAIYVLDAATGVDRLLAVAKADPIGLAIDGRRVAWAENVGRRGRIVSLLLPG